jgi:hypothetical protein
MKQAGGRRVRVRVNGHVVECVTIGGLAAVFNRTPHTLRCWQRSGLIPPAPFLLRSDDYRAVRRLYPIELVDALVPVVESGRFGRRRRSGRYLPQHAQIMEVWNAAVRSLRPENTGVIRSGQS